jgi:PKD repeat protein
MDIPLVVLNLCPPCPQVSITGLNTVCTGDIAVLDANPANLPGYTYTWSPGGFVGSTFNTGPLTSTTTFTVTITDGICTSTATHTVNVTPLTIPIFSQVGPYCPGSTIPPLPTTSLNGITGAWSPAINNSATTTYTFTPDPGQCANPTSLTIAIDPCCLNLDFCFNIDNRKLTFTSITPNTNPSPCTYRYKWIWGDGTSTAFTTSANTAKNQTKTYTNEGTYTVCLVVEKLCNGVVVCCQQICKEIKTVPLCDATRINAELGLSIVNTPNGTIVTPIRGTAFKSLTGTQLSINFGTPMLPNYNVATGANTFSTAPAAVTYTVPGTYEYCVTLTYTNAFGDQCIDKRCKTIVIEPWCATQAHFRYSSCAQSNSFNFTPIGNAAGTQVFWDFGDGTNGNSIGNAPINKIFANPGVYQVCMTVINGKCESQACYTIIVNQSVVSNCMPQNLMLSSNPNEVTELDDIPLEQILLPSNEDSDISSMVYPNPASGIVHVLISTGSEKEAKIELRTLEGRLIQSTMKSVNQENSKETMDVSGLESGIYIISIEIDGQIVTHKIMVNN